MMLQDYAVVTKTPRQKYSQRDTAQGKNVQLKRKKTKNLLRITKHSVNGHKAYGRYTMYTCPILIHTRAPTLAHCQRQDTLGEYAISQYS